MAGRVGSGDCWRVESRELRVESSLPTLDSRLSTLDFFQRRAALAAELLVCRIVRTALRAAIRQCRAAIATELLASRVVAAAVCTGHGAFIPPWSEVHSRQSRVERGRRGESRLYALGCRLPSFQLVQRLAPPMVVRVEALGEPVNQG